MMSIVYALGVSRKKRACTMHCEVASMSYLNRIGGFLVPPLKKKKKKGKEGGKWRVRG